MSVNAVESCLILCSFCPCLQTVNSRELGTLHKGKPHSPGSRKQTLCWATKPRE